MPYNFNCGIVYCFKDYLWFCHQKFDLYVLVYVYELKINKKKISSLSSFICITFQNDIMIELQLNRQLSNRMILFNNDWTWYQFLFYAREQWFFRITFYGFYFLKKNLNTLSVTLVPENWSIFCFGHWCMGPTVSKLKNKYCNLIEFIKTI